VKRFLLLGGFFGVGIVVVTACTSPSGSQHNQGPKPRSSITTSDSPPTRAAGRPGYSAARKEWFAEGKVIGSAGQSIPIEKALADLERGEIIDSGNRSAYPAIIAALKNFESFPDAMVTRAQRVQGQADTVKIDRFFHIDGNLPCTRWPSSRKACWEPASSSS
jgi:hypothetical protein